LTNNGGDLINMLQSTIEVHQYMQLTKLSQKIEGRGYKITGSVNIIEIDLYAKTRGSRFPRKMFLSRVLSDFLAQPIKTNNYRTNTKGAHRRLIK
jgi:hypothetical protein